MSAAPDSPKQARTEAPQGEGTPVSRPRVVLVEDEASLRRFVSMTLENLPIDLIECDGVAQALSALEQAPAQLILTDLMMPVESGLSLLERLRHSPALRGDGKVIVLSAGLNAATRQQLMTYDVWRMVDKPVSVRQLEALVKDALFGATEAAPVVPAVAVAPTVHSPAAQAEPVPLLEESDPVKAAEQYFEGDMAFFEDYRATCLEQFPHDIAAGDAACHSQDLKALRLVVHSLKSVLLTLGYPRLSAVARGLEEQCQHHQTEPALAGWPALREPLKQLLMLS